MKLRLHYIFIFLLQLLISQNTVFPQETSEQKFLKGVELYTGSNYQEALDTWLELYNNGFRSSSLLYNIGNAYFKLSNLPGAILFYERARLLKPSDENINYNLQIARSMVVDRFDEIPELFFVRWFNFISLLVSANGWALVSLVSFILFLVLISVYLYSSKYHIKVISFWISVFCIFLTIASLSFTYRNKSLVYESREAIIFTPSVSGKSSPDESGTDLFVIHEGTKVKIEDTVGGWHEIRLSDGNKGWVPVNCLTVI